jgi:hypothetical protein
VILSVIALTVAVLAVTGVAAAVWFDVLRHNRPDWVVRDQIRAKVGVQLHSGESFMGVLAAADRSTIALVEVTETTNPETVRPVDGRLLIDRARVAYVQVV